MMSKPQGFSLLEVLVVIAVIALLATLVVPNTVGFLASGKEKAYGGDSQVLQLSIDAWRATIGRTTGPLSPILQCEANTNTAALCITTGTADADFSEDCLGKIDENGLGQQISVSSGAETIDVYCDPYLDIAAIATEGFISNPAAVKSANTIFNTTAINDGGSYGWLVSSGGLMDSFPVFQKGLYP